MAETRDSHMTVPQVAKALQMSPDGVYKLIRRGKLKAVRISERKTYVSRLALDAYRRRLNGEGPDTTRPRSGASAADLRLDFERETGLTPEKWIGEWKRDRIEDSAENMQLLVRAVGLRVARTAEPARRKRSVSRPGPKPATSECGRKTRRKPAKQPV
jgi:excisionase family DNA binding protein